MARRTEFRRAIAALAVLATVPLWMPDYWMFLSVNGLVYAVAVLSIVLLARATASVSLCQASFMGIGAYTCAWLFTEQGWPYLAAAVAGAVIPVPIGALLAFPALRLRGLELAVLTLTVGLAAAALVFSPRGPFAFGDSTGVRLAGPVEPFGLDLTHIDTMFWAQLVVVAVAFVAVIWLLAGPVGATWQAMRAGNAVAAASGIRISRYQQLGFAVSSLLAGTAGVMLVTQQGTVNPLGFSVFASILLVVVAVVGGIDDVRSAAIGGFLMGLGFQIFPAFGLQGDYLILFVGFFVVIARVARQKHGPATSLLAP